MPRLVPILLLTLSCLALLGAEPEAATAPKPDADGFYTLFDGKSLDGWKAGENPDTFKLVDGQICANGPRAHLFYVGPVNNHEFKNFHFKAEVMTFPNANSGIYFHTKFQEANWPAQGYECQVNNTYAKDPRKTASLYAVKDVKEAPAKDNEWFTYKITVNDNRVQIAIDGKTLVDYEEPAGKEAFSADFERRLSPEGGTFALQCHDPKSVVYFKNLKFKPLK